MIFNLIVLAIVGNWVQIVLASTLEIPCKNSKQAEGFCTTLEECPHLNDLYSKGQLNALDICSFRGKLTVCCDKSFLPRISTLSPVEEIKKRPSQKYCDDLKESLPPITSTVILFGQQADHGEFPHMAALFNENNNGKVDCGGTLINSEYIITAAHCMANRGQRRMNPLKKVILGAIDVTLDEEPEPGDDRIEVEVESVCIHPEYQIKYIYNDIALLRLKTPIRKFSSYVHPACLYNGENFPENKKLHIIGWGGIDSQNSDIGSRFLLKGINEAYSLERCNQSYVQDRVKQLPRGLQSSQICTRDPRGIHSGTFCRGDSGGPLQTVLVSKKSLFNLVGIMSYGMRNPCRGDYPAIYTRVAHYLDWIEQIVWSNGTSTDHLCKRRS